ncbi:MAG: ABC transporter ATP-binding protein [Patescibacteria group bacterium]
MKNIQKIIALSKPLCALTWLLSLLVLVMSILQQAQPFFIKFIVDNIQLQLTNQQGNFKTVAYLMLGLLVVNLVSSILNSLSMRFGDYINSRLRRYLTEEFYSHVFTLPQKYFDSEISGKILNQLVRGIQSIQDFMGMFTNFVLPAIFQSIFTVGILFYYSGPIGLLALLIFPAYIYMSHYSTKKWGVEEMKKNRLEDITRGRISEVIGNIRLVRGFMAQAPEWKLVSKTLAKVNQIYDRQSTTYHLINFFREFSLELVLILISLITFNQTFKGQLSLGEMVLILQLINLLRRPLFAMSFILERIQAAESGSKEYFTIMDLKEEEKLNLLALPKSKLISRPSLHFDQVSFRYDTTGNEVLKKISFKIPSGQTVALVGHSGAGKSTIINLILKFYQPAGGGIYLNERSYSHLNHGFIRSHISLVFQDNELFSTTIRENVSYGMAKASDQAIISALKKANAYDFVMDLPGKLDAQIGERGVKLSGGQKQRIQISRAIMRNSPILILDEATSSLDSKSESAIQSALEYLMKNKLTIIIAHRFSTIQSADQILVIDQGKLVGCGTPAELAKQPGVYSELLRYQISGNEKLLAKYDLH